jgi:hypothetical protein
VVASADGTTRYVIAQPLEETGLSTEHTREAGIRKERRREFIEQCDREDPLLAWSDSNYARKRIGKVNLARLHGGLRR